jgi:hypothetical protein
LRRPLAALRGYDASQGKHQRDGDFRGRQIISCFLTLMHMTAGAKIVRGRVRRAVL